MSLVLDSLDPGVALPPEAALFRLLAELSAQVGDSHVAEILRISEAELADLREGRSEWTDEMAAALEMACAPLGLSLEGLDWDGDGSADVSWDQLAEYDAAEPASVAEPAAPDPSAGDAPVGLAARGQRWADEMEQRRAALWGARSLSILFQFRMGMTYGQLLDAYEVVTKLELALIMTFFDSVPEPGMNWDAARRAREIEYRLARLRWVERERNMEYKGVVGFVKKVVAGKRRWVSGKDLYNRMLEESEAMISSGKAVAGDLRNPMGGGLPPSRELLAGEPARTRSRDGSPLVALPGGGGRQPRSVAYPEWLLDGLVGLETEEGGEVIEA